MLCPIPVEIYEELIYFYERARYKWWHTRGAYKIHYNMVKKCQELGISIYTARMATQHAKRIGMIEKTSY